MDQELEMHWLMPVIQQAIEASKFSPAEMTTFPTLTDEQIKSIIAYAKAGEPKKAEDAGAAKAGAGADEVSSFSIAGYRFNYSDLYSCTGCFRPCSKDAGEFDP